MLALTNDWSVEAYEVIKQHTHTNTNTHSLVYFDNAETADGLLLIAACRNGFVIGFQTAFT